MSCGTTRYTASGTTTRVSTKARSTGCHDSAIGASRSMPRATSGKIAIQVMTARTCTEGGPAGAAGAAGRMPGVRNAVSASVLLFIRDLLTVFPTEWLLFNHAVPDFTTIQLENC